MMMVIFLSDNRSALKRDDISVVAINEYRNKYFRSHDYCTVCYIMTIQTYCFSNGFQYIVQQLETTHNKSMIYILCEAGSIFEPDDKNGMAHIVEHLLFMTRSGKQPSSSILQNFDSMGVEFNAHTVKQFTIFKFQLSKVIIFIN